MKLPKAKTENIVVQAAGDERMIYDVRLDRAYLLNATSAFVWEMCDGENDLASISHALAAKTNREINEDVVKLAIDQLKANDLLVEADNLKDFFTKTNRRKAIKQIGLATMIALPVISALTAPTSAHARSMGCRTTGVCYPQGTKYCLPGCTGVHNITLFYGSINCSGGDPLTATLDCNSPYGANPSDYPFTLQS